MAFPIDKLGQARLLDWCRGEEVEPAKALLVTGIPEGTEVCKIEEVMHIVKALGCVSVKGKTFHSGQNSLLVLCVCVENQ